MAEEARPPRPPPLPPTYPPRPPAPPAATDRDRRFASSLDSQPSWHPLPLPRLTQEAPNRIDETVGGWLEPVPESMLGGRFSWIAMMGWAFILFVILLVVMPMDAIPKLIGPFKQPISAGGYGPLISIFAIGAVLVVLIGGVWTWIAMSRDYEAPPDEQLGAGL